MAVQRGARRAVEFNKLPCFRANHKIQFIDDHVLGGGGRAAHQAREEQSSAEGNQISFHGVGCEWTSKVAYLS